MSWDTLPEDLQSLIFAEIPELDVTPPTTVVVPTVVWADGARPVNQVKASDCRIIRSVKEVPGSSSPCASASSLRCRLINKKFAEKLKPLLFQTKDAQKCVRAVVEQTRFRPGLMFTTLCGAMDTGLCYMRSRNQHGVIYKALMEQVPESLGNVEPARRRGFLRVLQLL